MDFLNYCVEQDIKKYLDLVSEGLENGAIEGTDEQVFLINQECVYRGEHWNEVLK